MCGLWSLRPSAGRISLMDMSDSLVGQEAVKNAGGPMGHSARDLNLFMSAYMAYSPWKHDPVVLKMPWDGQIADPSEKSPLCFAIAWGDEQVSIQDFSLSAELIVGDSASPNPPRSATRSGRTEESWSYGGRLARAHRCQRDPGNHALVLGSRWWRRE